NSEPSSALRFRSFSIKGCAAERAPSGLGKMVHASFGTVRMGASVMLCATALMLSGCISLLPAQTDNVNGAFKNFDDVKAAYERVEPGRTRIGQLRQIGFDLTEPNVEQWSY